MGGGNGGGTASPHFLFCVVAEGVRKNVHLHPPRLRAVLPPSTHFFFYTLSTAYMMGMYAAYIGIMPMGILVCEHLVTCMFSVISSVCTLFLALFLKDSMFTDEFTGISRR